MGLHCTVLIPAYNTAQYIGEAIESVAGQTYEDWDILVVDDGSADGTADVVEKLRPDHPISLIRHERNRGAAHATKVGMEAVKGPVVTVLDSDDRLLPESLATVVPLFARDDRLGYAWTRFVCSDGRDGGAGPLPRGMSFWQALVYAGWWRGSAQRFVRKEIYMASRGLDPRVRSASDLQLAIVMAHTGCNVRWVNRVTYWYRRGRPGSISTVTLGEQFACARRIRELARSWGPCGAQQVSVSSSDRGMPLAGVSARGKGQI